MPKVKMAESGIPEVEVGSLVQVVNRLRNTTWVGMVCQVGPGIHELVRLENGNRGKDLASDTPLNLLRGFQADGQYAITVLPRGTVVTLTQD